MPTFYDRSRAAHVELSGNADIDPLVGIPGSASEDYTQKQYLYNSYDDPQGIQPIMETVAVTNMR